MNAEKKPGDDDFQKLVVGDLFCLNPMMQLIVPDEKRPGTDLMFVASERTMTEVVTNISLKTFDREFSLDARFRSDTMAVIRVRVYDPIIPIEGLV